MCVLLSLFCGCAHEVPKYLPGEQAGDENYVWVCKEPFAFFSVTYDPDIGYKGYLRGYGYIEGEEGFKDFYAIYNLINGRTSFHFPEFRDDDSSKDGFEGYAHYYKNHFVFLIVRDDINFFGGELPTLRFDKMTKEEFVKKYENLSDFVNSK